MSLEFVRRVSKEIKLQALAEHECLVPFLDCFSLNSTSIATVLEHCPNNTLDAYLNNYSILAEPQTKVFLIQILDSNSYRGEEHSIL
jgi:serine/threonine protein kinase